jgi:hypothetical protein
VPQNGDIDLKAEDISRLASLDAVAAFFTRLGYPTDRRKEQPATALGLPPETADAIRKMELLAEDDEQFLCVIFVQLRSITAKARNELVRNFGRRSADHLLVLTKDFDVLEFVLIDKQTRQRHAPGGGPSVQPIPLSVTVMRKASTHLDLRILRRLTWTGKDGLDQFDKLRSVFEAAHWSEKYFQNRALFADHYLETRLREDAAWSDDPSAAFAAVRNLFSNARGRWSNEPEQTIRDELYEPAWKLLGFKAKVANAANQDHPTPDYELHGSNGTLTVAFCYRWDRWLDGLDLNDPDTPDENPGAAVVSALAEGKARWAIVTNGKYWRLYSRDAHSRSTNFYEVDLEEALLASGETDPNEAFRYWWLFVRRQAFEPLPQAEQPTCWLDTIVQGSRDYAKRLGERLKERIFVEIFPHLAQGFLKDRKKRLGVTRRPTDDELKDAFEATLTLLYRLLFLLYAEARDLLPIREAAYKAASLKQIKEEIAEKAGIAETDVPTRLNAYPDTETTLYDHLARLFGVMDQGDAVLNVPCYNGGLFLTEPDHNSAEREHRIARFLLEHKVPDRYLALAIDRLARDVDEKNFSLAFIDYKSLEVRHLGSIYEGLLEFKLKIAEEDLTTTTEKKAEKYIPLSQAKPGRGKKAAATPVVRKGEVYLSNDKAERKATGSYYTPDPIVEYIVEHTVGPVLAEKLEALRADLNAAGSTYHRHLTNAKNNPGLLPKNADPRAFAASKTYAEHQALVDRVFDMKVLDPAMGSGHFLVETVDFITDRLLDFLNRFPNNPVQFALAKTRRSILDALGEQGVTVDPDKLTDINLLKRHVLKRCIYGVDLNPMAVELAKVSLWLDAFTLGAPLSFLDHHLRCGNSLIGATFEDLKKVTSGQLLGIDYAPLLRAIGHVLFVNEMSDATAAEVHKSADEYSQARRELSGYQIVLDLLVGDHFVDQPATGRGPTAAGHVQPSSLIRDTTLDLTTRDAFLAPLKDNARRTVAETEVVAHRSDLRFFHWEIEFPEVFFGFADTNRRHIKPRNDIAAGSAGFDAVVGNPPYDVLSSKETGSDIAALADWINARSEYAPSCKGKNNLYKLFVCRALHLVRFGGTWGFIVPMGILGNDQYSEIRRAVFAHGTLLCVDAFPQKDDPERRVFKDAKLATTILIAVRADPAEYATREFASRQHPAAVVESHSPCVRLTSRDVAAVDPNNLTVVSCSEDDWHLARRIASSDRVVRLSSVARWYQGEINETNERADGTLVDGGDALVVRGAAVCLYAVREASQGSDLWLDTRAFLSDKSPSSRAFHHRQARVIMQNASPQNNFRRLIAAVLPAGQFCSYKLNYCPEPDCRVSMHALLAMINSKLLDWYFRLLSTSADVNHYQLDVLPFPRFDVTPPRGTGRRRSQQYESLRRAAKASDWSGARAVVLPLIATPPFGPAALDCMELLVQEITDIETARGEIARAERSALASKAQPLQDLLDHMIYRMAGLADDDIAGLEERLARML